MNDRSQPLLSMDQLPTAHVLIAKEEAFLATLDEKHRRLHALAVQWLQTSYRLEWSHMYNNKPKK